MLKVRSLLFIIFITGVMFIYGCADNLKDSSQFSSIDNSSNNIDTGTGGNTGSGGDTGTGTDDNAGSGGDTGTGTDDNTGSGGDTGTGTDDNTGSGGDTGTGTDDNTGSGGNTDTENPDKKYTVTFHDNGADPLYNSMPPLTECTSKGIEITENIFLKSGYKFVGWSTAPNDEMIYRNMQVIK